MTKLIQGSRVPKRNLIIHLLLWSVYVLSEYLANIIHISATQRWIFLRSILLSLPLLMIPTYFIAFYAVPRLLQQRKIWLFVLVVIAMMGVVFYGRIKWLELINFINYDELQNIPPTKVLKNVIRDYAVIALAICLNIIGDWRKKELLNRQLTEAKAKIEIQLLKRQLHPHFLFNTLNNIYSLAMQNSSLTASSILKLSDLLDYLVYQTDKGEVSLSSEIKLIQNYIDLEKLRYGEQLKVDLRVSKVNDSLKTAPLILLPFVENCFKHGGKDENGLFWIKIKIKMFDGLLIVSVENSKRYKNHHPSPNKIGIGLKNVKERFNLLYPNRHQLTIEDNKHFFSVRLELKLDT
ncbi:sensor histidine kinase [Fulvivirgaceae bacterium BMA10]|uniref:Sensor histidine kinase n=1 Tax=Splendidivirga corallicola TaxID=3051826 RepID=A0ABT8KRU4_9BACT|nr:sensor histidine kinase [Fulvivirgaceae bacterium BMA10]